MIITLIIDVPSKRSFDKFVLIKNSTAYKALELAHSLADKFWPE